MGLLLRKFFQGLGLGASQHHLPSPEDSSAEDPIIEPRPTSAPSLTEALSLGLGLQGEGGAASVPKRETPPTLRAAAQPRSIGSGEGSLSSPQLMLHPSSEQPQACVLIPKTPRAGQMFRGRTHFLVSDPWTLETQTTCSTPPA